MSDFLYFKHKVTGLVSKQPAQYKDHPVLGAFLEVVDPSEAACLDCGVPDAVTEGPVEILLEEPTPVPTIRRSKKDTDNG